jgi:outer membrane protein TolC
MKHVLSLKTVFQRSCLLHLVLLLLLGSAVPVWSGAITYQDAVRDALNQSARIRVKSEDINISDAMYRQNFAGLYPEISANSRFERYENLDNRSGTLDTINGEVLGGDASAYKSSVSVTGQYYLSHWYKKSHEVSYYEKMRDVRVHECHVEVKKLLRELTDTFGALGEGRIKIRYGGDIMKRLRDVLALKKEAFARGQVSYEEVLKVEQALTNAEKEAAAVRKEFKENLERLRMYTGKVYEDDAEVDTAAARTPLKIEDSKKLIEDTPEYKARLKELEAVRLKEKAAANNFLPDISLYGRYNLYGSSINSIDSSARDLREVSYAAGVLVSLPIFDGGVRKWDRKRNLYEIRKQDETLKAVREEKGRDIKILQAGSRELSKSLTHYRKLAEQYGRMLEITKKAHGLGERSVMEIMEMEKDAITVERDLKVTEMSMTTYERRTVLESDYNNFIREHYGNGTCKY